jgi:hypothetical protein
MRQPFVLIFTIILFCIGCKKDPLEQYSGVYSGNKRIEVYYDSINVVTHEVTSSIKFDTVICKIEVIPNGKKIDIKELDSNNILIKFWHGIEVNNVGELAYFGTDSVAYGNISTSEFSLFLNFTPTIQSDTNFYAYYYNLSR